MKPTLNRKKIYEEYGGGVLKLIWQNGVLFDSTGKVLPKDVNFLAKSGYKVNRTLRKKISTYADTVRMQRELDSLKSRQAAEFKRREAELKAKIDALYKEEDLKAKVTENPNYLNTDVRDNSQPMPNLFPEEVDSQNYLQNVEPDGVPEEEYDEDDSEYLENPEYDEEGFEDIDLDNEEEQEEVESFSQTPPPLPAAPQPVALPPIPITRKRGK